MKLIIDNEICEVSEKAMNLILRQTRDYAKPGAAYAVKKGDTVKLLNEAVNGNKYEQQGFTVIRK